MNNLLKNPPIALMHRVFTGAASAQDIYSAKIYVSFLQAAARNVVIELKKPVPGEPLYAGNATFEAIDEKTGEAREFIAEVFHNRTVSWFDGHGMREAVAAAARAGGPKAKQVAENRASEFVITTTIGEELYHLVNEANVILCKGSDITEEMSEKVAHAMAPYFWRDVNPFLTRPMAQE